MQFEVPQFIEIEDKIFGPLTWKQFIYLAGGIGAAVVIFLTLPTILFVFLGIPAAVLGGALAFYPVNNRPFNYFLESLFGFITRKRLYLWRQKTDIVHKASTETNTPTPSTQSQAVGQTATKPKRNISSLARELELKALQKN